jgi:hypothetical protein
MLVLSSDIESPRDRLHPYDFHRGRRMFEYLFVDERRLNSYFEQISAPVIYDKVPTWNVELSLAGPKAAGTQTRQGREPTTHEKIERFVKYVQTNNLITSERPSLVNADRVKGLFFMEKLTMRRVQIKRNDEALNIWVTEPRLEKEFDPNVDEFPLGALFLIEDFRGDEGRDRTYTGYSSLYLLTEELVSENRDTINDVFNQLRKQDDVTRLFAVDPLGTLKFLGGRIGPERHIVTVYRYRASCIEMEDVRGRATTTIGYPIFVRESA